MRLHAHAASAGQTAVLQYVPAADRAHTLSESVGPHPFFLFRLIDTLRHGVSISMFALWYNNPDMMVITKPIPLSKVKSLTKNRQHKDLTIARWGKLSLVEQLAHIGSEVIRATRWQKKGNAEYAMLAFYRALELTDCTLAQSLNNATLRELARMREMLVDYFIGKNIYGSTASSWQSYFGAFTFAASRMRA
jgi:hypothetical protein